MGFFVIFIVTIMCKRLLKDFDLGKKQMTKSNETYFIVQYIWPIIFQISLTLKKKKKTIH